MARRPTAPAPQGTSRRSALKGLGATAGLAAIASGCTTGGDDVGDDTDTDTTPLDPKTAIDTFVILMMENRTFDHYLGALTLDEGRDDVDGLTAGMENPDADGVMVPVHPLELACIEDPPHGWDRSHDQFDGGTNAGFVRAHDDGRSTFARTVMGYMRRADLPISYALADDNAVCDRWFASVMGPTWPNRIYSLCATSDGMKSNDFSRAPFKLRSIFEQLDEAGVSWAVYYHDLPFATLVDYTGGLFGPNMRPIEQYFDDAANGTLPKVCFVEPSYGANDDHPPHAPILGQVLIGAVYKALAESPQWERSMMIVDYDEHGGFYDHVAPPTTADDHAADGFDQLGFRVPSLVLGPYARTEAIHTQFDHTSVLKHLQEVFGMDALTARNAAANPLWDCLDLDAMAARQPRAPTTLPVVDIDPADFTGGCYAYIDPGQPELERLFDMGILDARLDRRALTMEVVDRVLLRAEKLGLVRLAGL
ncbi:MAG: alkaline phosphatase family protein [Alphaproteobacteria bacterium]|nr:alkaline phosphatase family protein [Alphaproteobacteria bacterium]